MTIHRKGLDGRAMPNMPRTKSPPIQEPAENRVVKLLAYNSNLDAWEEYNIPAMPKRQMLVIARQIVHVNPHMILCMETDAPPRKFELVSGRFVQGSLTVTLLERKSAGGNSVV